MGKLIGAFCLLIGTLQAQYHPPGTVTVIPDIRVFTFATCIAGVPQGLVATATSNFNPLCRGGANNLGGQYQAIPATGAALQFQLELPLDWDTTKQPYVNVYFGAGGNASGTAVWTASSACIDMSVNGGAASDPAFNSEPAFTTVTFVASARVWYTGGQFTAITSGNGCKPIGILIIQLTVSGTASGNINGYQAVVTIPRIPVVQAN